MVNCTDESVNLKLKIMKRVRLDVGAISANSEREDSFYFFLYCNELKKGISANLTPAEMHSILSNFKKIKEDAISTQTLLYSVLSTYNIELLDVMIVRRADNKEFASNLMFYNGVEEELLEASFVDGVILSKSFGAPIYIDESLMKKYSVSIDSIIEKNVKKETRISNLKVQLQEAIKVEDYERAAIISEEISRYNVDKKKLNR